MARRQRVDEIANRGVAFEEIHGFNCNISVSAVAAGRGESSLLIDPVYFGWYKTLRILKNVIRFSRLTKGRITAENPFRMMDLDNVPFLDFHELTGKVPVVLVDSPILFSYIMAVHTRIHPHAGVERTVKTISNKNWRETLEMSVFCSLLETSPSTLRIILTMVLIKNCNGVRVSKVENTKLSVEWFAITLINQMLNKNEGTMVQISVVVKYKYCINGISGGCYNCFIFSCIRTSQLESWARRRMIQGRQNPAVENLRFLIPQRDSVQWGEGRDLDKGDIMRELIGDGKLPQMGKRRDSECMAKYLKRIDVSG